MNLENYIYKNVCVHVEEWEQFRGVLLARKNREKKLENSIYFNCLFDVVVDYPSIGSDFNGTYFC